MFQTMLLDIPHIFISKMKVLYKIIIDRFFLGYKKKKAKIFFKKKDYLKYFFEGSTNEFMPNFIDLERLFKLIIKRKPKVILEFGSGFSTIAICLALREIKAKENFIGKLISVEGNKKWFDNTKNKINDDLKPFVKIKYSASNSILIDNQLASLHESLPNVSPNFIYLDGPSQFNVKKDINGISTRHKDMLPMVSDILKLEHFYTPGTMIVCDGRAANAKFLKDNFKRRWKYLNNLKTDQHIFWLIDPVLGKYNNLQIEFYNKK